MTTAELLFPQPVGHPHMAWDTGDQGSADSPFARLTSPVPSYQTASPIIGVKEYRRLGRPKSVPLSLHQHDNHQHKTSHRPCTAVVPGAKECGRVHHEPTRKQEMNAHLPLRKPRPPPWQKGLDSQPVPVVVTPAYVLARSKSKVEMNINTDQFFDQPPRKMDIPRSSDPERDALIAHLQQQIDDLTLFLEEERLNHRDTKRKAVEQLRDKVEEMTNQHNNHLRLLDEQHRELVEEMNRQHQQQLDEQRMATDASFKKLNGELEFLQGAFESYKSQLHLEMNERWKKKEDDMKIKHEEEIQQRIHELRTRLVADRNNEKAEMGKEHQKEIQNLRKDHKRELDDLLRRFSNAAADLEKLKQAEKIILEKDAEVKELQKDYDNVCHQLTDATRDLTDTKVKLIGYEQHFQEKVQQIDDKYKLEIHELMTQNTELRRMFMKKCGELYDEKAVTEETRVKRMESAKDTMKYLVETRNRAMVSMACGDERLEDMAVEAKDRPSSAPITRGESAKARVNAGQTDDYIYRQEDQSRPSTGRPRILDHIKTEGEEGYDETRQADIKDLQRFLEGQS